MSQEKKITNNGEKILIISSNLDFARKIVKELVNIGYNAKSESDGNSGLKAVFDILPHLILLDTEISQIDSYSILEKIHKESLLTKIPIFLVSSTGLPINMNKVPPESVKEFIVTLHGNIKNIIEKINYLFGVNNHTNMKTETIGEKKKVLWIEDDKLIGSILGRKIMASNYDLHQVLNGELALRELESMEPDIIIIDLLLPGMSGFDTLQKIRNIPKLKKVPVMILSNLSKPSDIERAKTLGAQKFLVKATVSLDQIITEIKDLLR